MKKIFFLFLTSFFFCSAFGQTPPDGFVYVEGGTFEMGSSKKKSGDTTAYIVTLKGFYMSKYEVIQLTWNALMEENPSIIKGDSLPVAQVYFIDAVLFCNALSRQDGLEECYVVPEGRGPIQFYPLRNGYRLPTEAEWEYAARGGNKSKGYQYAGSDKIKEVAWYKRNSRQTIHKVGQKKPNELGLYDMSGNAAERCWDWFGVYPNDSVINPTGHHGMYIDARRIFRGGDWRYSKRSCTNFSRGTDIYIFNTAPIGIRLVRNL